MIPDPYNIDRGDSNVDKHNEADRSSAFESVSASANLPTGDNLWFDWRDTPITAYLQELDDAYRGLAVSATQLASEDPQAARAAGLVAAQLAHYESDQVAAYNEQTALDQDLESISLGNEHRIRFLESQIHETEATNRRYEIELEGARLGLKNMRFRFSRVGLLRLRQIALRDKSLHTAYRQYGSSTGHQALIEGIRHARKVALQHNDATELRTQIITLSEPIKQKFAAISINCQDIRSAQKEIKSIAKMGTRKERRLINKGLKLNSDRGDLEEQVVTQHLASGKKIASEKIHFSNSDALYAEIDEVSQKLAIERTSITELKQNVEGIDWKHFWIGILQIALFVGALTLLFFATCVGTR